MPHKRTDPQTFHFARELRRNLTPAEQRLWRRLRNHQLGGHKFRRQHAIGPFIVDFCCPACHLTIELDGDTHAGQEEYDQARTRWLLEQGWRELRFTNREIEGELEAVLKAILEALRQE